MRSRGGNRLWLDIIRNDSNRVTGFSASYNKVIKMAVFEPGGLGYKINPYVEK